MNTNLIHHRRHPYKKIREIIGKKKLVRSTLVNVRYSTILMDQSDVLKRRREFVGDLYCDNERADLEIQKEDTDTGLPILRFKVKLAVEKMKWRKAEGMDQFEVEMIKALDEFAIDKLTRIANQIHSTGTILQAIKESELIVIPKKVGVVN